jgi:hypothetical protein
VDEAEEVFDLVLPACAQPSKVMVRQTAARPSSADDSGTAGDHPVSSLSAYPMRSNELNPLYFRDLRRACTSLPLCTHC